MDMLDPLDSSAEVEEVESKVILNDNVISKNSVESDDEQNVVDHLSPQTLLETPPDNEVQYSLRSPEGMITYRVLQVEEGVESVPQIVTTGSNFSNTNVQQVLTSNLNGQVYVIGNPNDVFATQAGARAIAPRSSIIDNSTSVVTNIKRRDERRRATHNEVERRRRDKINNWITKLSKIIPENTPPDMKGNGHYDGQSKGGILAKACEYILELRDNEQKCDLYMKENKQLSQALELLKQKNAALEQENRTFREILKRNGLDVPNSIMS
ncbi:Upstream stimulatory factor 2-like Protein [Tribolium castaneum]|uniref:Upstream stimulatory factor 2-like Protein n=2 Tax=Tribolium castaneum TaxID=7070 RepID=D2A376_TRICA|nr:Upstream stimulatory factor 2-like Protein [Tribolium castaneum]